jgi:hypothetical protein
VLGAGNQTNKTTTLKTTSAVTGPTLKLRNTGGGPAAQFITKAGKAPFKVSGNTKVSGLNADLLDGISSESFVRNDTTPLTAIMARDGSTLETAATATGKILTFNVELYDPSNMNQATSDRLIAPVAGTYVVSTTVDWSPNATGYRVIAVEDSQGTDFGGAIGPATNAVAFTRQNATGIIHLEAGDFVRVQALQGSGGDLDVRIVRFQMTYVGA